MKFIALLGAFLLHQAFAAECVASDIPDPTFKDDIQGRRVETTSRRVVMGAVGNAPILSKGGCAECGDTRVGANGVVVRANRQGAIVYGPSYMSSGATTRCSGPGCNQQTIRSNQQSAASQSSYRTVQSSQSGLSEYSSNGIMSGENGIADTSQTLSYSLSNGGSDTYQGAGGVLVQSYDPSQMPTNQAVRQNVVILDGASSGQTQGQIATGQYGGSATGYTGIVSTSGAVGGVYDNGQVTTRQFDATTGQPYRQQNLSAQKQARLRQQLNSADPSQLIKVTTTTLPGTAPGIASTTTTTQSVVSASDVIRPQGDMLSYGSNGISSTGGSTSYSSQSSGSYSTTGTSLDVAPAVVAPDDRPAEVQNVINIPMTSGSATTFNGGSNGITYGSATNGQTETYTMTTGSGSMNGLSNGATMTNGVSTINGGSSSSGSFTVGGSSSSSSTSSSSSQTSNGAYELPSDVYVPGKTTPNTAYTATSTSSPTVTTSSSMTQTSVIPIAKPVVLVDPPAIQAVAPIAPSLTSVTSSSQLSSSGSMSTQTVPTRPMTLTATEPINTAFTTTSSTRESVPITMTRVKNPQSYQTVQNGAITSSTGSQNTQMISGSSMSSNSVSSSVTDSTFSGVNKANLLTSGQTTFNTVNGAAGVSASGTVPVVNRPDSNIQVVNQHVGQVETKTISTTQVTVPQVKADNIQVQNVKQAEPVTITPTASNSQVVIPRAEIIKDERAIKPGCNAAQTLEAPNHRVDKFDVSASQREVGDFSIEMKERKQAQISKENRQASQARYEANVNALRQTKELSINQMDIKLKREKGVADDLEKQLSDIKMKRVDLPTVQTKYNAPQFYKPKAATITQYTMPAKKAVSQAYVYREEVCGALNCPKINYVRKDK